MDKSWSPRARRSLLAGYGALLIASLLLGSNAVLTARDLGRQGAELQRAELLGISRLREANVDLMAADSALRQMVLAPTFVDRDDARARLERAMLDLELQVAAARQVISRDGEKMLLNEFVPAFEHYRRSVDEATALIDRSFDYQVKATAYVSGEPFRQAGDAADRLLHRLAALKEEGARETANAIARQARDAQWLALALLAACLLLGVAIASVTQRALNQPVNRQRHILEGPPRDAADGGRDDIDMAEPFAAIDKQETDSRRADARAVAEFPDDSQSVDEVDAIVAPGHAAEIAAAAVVPQDTAPRSASILVVEDLASSQEVGVDLQANADCQVTIAGSGQEALQLLQQAPYDLVLMNMRMPMTDGISTALEIRKNTALDRLPIIAMSADGAHQDRQRCLSAGMNGYIAKPIEPDKLYRALMCWISPDGRDRNDAAFASARSGA